MLPDVRGLSWAAVSAVVARPDLWTVAGRTVLSVAPNNWWRKRPFLPLPDDAWMHFRLETAYGGDGTSAMGAEELITYLEWRKEFPGR